MDKIVVGLDGSARSCAALRWALDHAQRVAAPVDVVAVWEQPVNYGAIPPVGAPAMTYAGVAAEPVDDVREALRNEALHRIDEALAGCSDLTQGVEVRRHEVEGHAGPALAEMARGASVLVVGRSGHGPFVGLLMGSVAQHVSGHAPCPVVIVPGAEDSDPDDRDGDEGRG